MMFTGAHCYVITYDDLDVRFRHGSCVSLGAITHHLGQEAQLLPRSSQL